MPIAVEERLMSLMQALPSANAGLGQVRNDWTRAQVRALFALPFPELMFEAQRVHRLHFDPLEVQISTLLSIKTGGCPEDGAYCPQSAHYDTGVQAEKLMRAETVLAEARAQGSRPRRRWWRASRRSAWKPAPRSAC
jgi:biotin synthase